jgi:hypothetical protein
VRAIAAEHLEEPEEAIIVHDPKEEGMKVLKKRATRPLKPELDAYTLHIMCFRKN